MKTILITLLWIFVVNAQLLSGARSVQTDSFKLVFDLHDSLDWADSTTRADADSESVIDLNRWYDFFWMEIEDSTLTVFVDSTDADDSDSLYYRGRLDADSLETLFTADTAEAWIGKQVLNGKTLHAALVAVRVDSDSTGYDTLQSVMGISEFENKENYSVPSAGVIRGSGNGSLR